MLRQKSEIFSAVLEYSGGERMSQIITLMEFRWSKRKKETRNRDGEIAKVPHIDCITNTPFERKVTELTEKRILYLMNNHGIFRALK
jgi:hypothetical protein